MKIPVRRSCISLIVLSAFVEAIRANENETSTAEDRQGRVSGRIVKLYSGYKPDPVLCIEEGFKADPIQCSVFYRCLKSSSGKFTVFKFQCGPGTVYDPETEVCNHPGSTKRSECGGIKSNVEQDNENYIDQHELPSPISTSVPIYTSAASNVTGYTSYKVPSPSSSDVPSIENGYINYMTTSSPPYHAESTSEKVQDITQNQVTHPWTEKNMMQSKITSSTTIFPILEKNEPCTVDGFMGDRENCNKFYRCVSNLRGGFIRYEFLCSEPTVWDDHMQSCNHPWAVRSKRCGRGGISNENNTQISHLSNNISTEQMGVSYGIKLPETLNQENNDLSVLQQPPTTYGNKLNNEDEYNIEKNQISYGTPLSNHKHIENETNQLDKINDDFNFGQKINVQPTYSTNKLAENSVTPHIEISQHFICTQSGFVGDYTDCKKFYRCVENGGGTFTKYEFTCSQGTVWDKKLEACNYGWAVKECGGALTGDSIITGGTLTSSTSASTTTLNENFENGYVNNLSQQYESPITVTVSTPVTLISTTAASNLKGAECTETGFIGDKNDCKKFYRCVDNGRGTFTKYEYKCGDGTLWDQNIEACNHAWAVQSCNSPSSNDSMHTTSEATIKTNSTTFLIQSTTTEKLEHSNDYSNTYGPQLDAEPLNPEIDLHKTTLAPMINQKNDCDSTGFRGDSNDCKKFYRCVDNGQRGFIKYEFSCGEGTVWDPEIEACNHAWAVKHCGSSIPLEDQVTMGSTDNTHSSTHDLVVTTAISSMKPATQQTAIIDYDSGYGQQQIESTKIPYVKLETTTLKQTIGQTNNSCQSAGFIGDINDCSKFYRCVDNGNGGFIRHEFSCGEGTVWDSEIEACNHVWAVKHCGGSISSTENLLTSSTTHLNVVESNDGYVTHNYIDSQSNSENIGETTTLSSSKSTVTTVTNTRIECKSSGFMGDNSDCHKFYRCVDNGNGGFIKHEFICGEGTVWDSRIEACNHEWAVEKCGGNSYNEFVETTTTSLQPTSPVTESVPTSTLSVIYSSSTTSTTKNTLPSHEDRECSSEGYFANPHDCKKFYRCVNEGKDGYTKYEFSCAEGTAWDVKIQSCNYISQVEACHLNQHQINTTETKPIHDEQIMDSDTTKSTTSASTTSTSSTTTSTASSSTTLSSTTSASTTKNPKPAGQNTCKDDGYFGDTNDCKKFYRCVYESNEVYTKYDFTCGDGTIWDQDIIACNHPRDVGNPSCKSESESTSPISTSSTSSTTTDNNENPSSTTTNKPLTSTVAATNNHTNSSCTNSTSENPTSQNFTCSKAGFYADPSDCKKFYRCVDWENNGKKFSIYHFDCADGTIWDPALETCNHEDSVYPPRNCNNTQEQNENTSETSSTTEPITTTTKQTESTTTSSEPCKTTTQSTSTSEYSSTQTTQSSTTGGSTTEESTTQSSTTEESTTQSSTTEESTTQTSTTQSPTTEESTTQTSTTQSSTTEESTLQTSTTQSPPTEESTTQTSTTQSSTTEESTTQTSTTQSPTTEESTTQTSTTQSSTTEESTTQTSTTQSSTTEESTTHSSTTEESTTQSSTNKEPATEESTTSTTNEQTTTTTQMTTSATDQTSTTTEPSTTTTEGSSSSTTESNQESTTESSSKNECPDTADDQHLYVCPTSFKRHPKYCNLFYQCTEDKDSHELKIAVFRCPNNTIYDENKIQCLADNESSKKCNGQISQKPSPKQLGATQIDPFVVTKESMACQKSGHYPFEKNTECSSSLLKCELTKSGKLRGFVYRCPEGFVYWNISRRCEPIRKVRDCKGSSYSWKRRYDIPLERFNIAS